MEQLAKSLMQFKSSKDRLQSLNESLNHLSFHHSNLFIMLFREIKKREMEYNDSSRMTNWLSTSKSNSYVKLHEALILVKGHNNLAKDNYLFNLKHMLNDAVETGSNIDAAIKICCLIEKSPHLSTIYESLKHLIQKVNQMKYNKHNSRAGNMKWNNNFEATLTNPFEQLKIQSAQQQQTSDWPTMIQSTSSNSVHSLPHFNLNSFGYNHLELIATLNSVNQMKYNQCISCSKSIKFKSNAINNFEQMQYSKQQQTPAWSTKISASVLNSAYGLPYFNLNCFGYDHIEMIATANRRPAFNFSPAHFNLTIVNQGMDGAFIKWLYYLKLHKYQWFFNGLSYLEIECIDEDNIEGFISKVNISSIPKGTQKKICLSIKALRDRKKKFKDLIMYLDLEVTLIELCDYMTYMFDILHYPIPNDNCVVGDQLQQDIILIMEKALSQILEKLDAIGTLIAQSLLGMAINKFLNCSLLIYRNQIFMRHQVQKTAMLAETLKYKVNQVPRNFN